MKIQRLMLAALAVCGTTAALAQSSVTLYGRVNTSIERQKIGDQSVTGMYNNASRFGFKGVEDLGGGLKAGFVLESGFDSSSGAGSAAGGGMNFGRQSELNLSGNFGMLRMGTFTSESYYAVADYGVLDEPNHDTGHASDALYAYVMRDSNKIAYRTPAFGGFTLEAATSLHERAAGTGNKNGYDLAANWESGALALGLGFSKVGDAKQVGVRAHYTIGAFQIGGYYQRAEDDLAVNSGTRNVYRLTGGYTFGASQIAVGYGRTSKADNIPESGAQQLILGYNYNLSKRTKVYGIYTRVNNKAGAGYMTGTAGADYSTFGAGIRHNF